MAMSVSSFGTLYPDSGPLSRDHYPKHIDFFNAGAKSRERAILGGNRCITPWTPVEMPRATRRCGEIPVGSSFDVRSWDGDSRCTKSASGVFLKSIEPAFRLHLDNGQFFDCSSRHRVLTLAGWMPTFQLIRSASGLHCYRTEEGSRASYYEDGYLRGEPLRLSSDSVQGKLPSQGSAPPLGQNCGRGDASESRYSRIRAFQEICRFSTLDDPILIADLCGLFEDPTASLDVLWCSGLRRDLSLLAIELSRKRACAEVPDHRSLCVESLAGRHGSPFFQETLSRGFPKTRNGRQSSSWCSPSSPFLESLQDAPHMEMFFPSDHYPLLGGNKIVSVVCLGIQPIMDFTVEQTHCYESGGVIHHNTGKTHLGSYEAVCHLTGLYPSWWEGKRFTKPTRGWAAGDTAKTVRDILQAKLCGTVDEPDSGMIPRSLIRDVSRKTHIADAYETVYVEHVTGGTSVLSLKSYDQKRKSFQGTSQDWIWLDEEVDEDIYGECVMRTMKTSTFGGGIIYLTFTPLKGLTPVVLLYLPDGEHATTDRVVVMMGWDDVPHLEKAEIDELYRKTPAHLRDARSKGIPQLGSGAIYPVEESTILVDPFEVPRHWPRGYGMDVGWNATAAMFAAFDRENQILYFTSEYKRGEAEPSVHAEVIKGRAKGWPGFIDPAAKGRSQSDGKQLLVQYRALGLDLQIAGNSVEVGISDIWDLMTAGRLKVFKNLEQWKAERRLYRRDTKGIVVKEKDHLMDAGRYLNSRRDLMRVISAPKTVSSGNKQGGSLSWVR